MAVERDLGYPQHASIRALHSFVFIPRRVAQVQMTDVREQGEHLQPGAELAYRRPTHVDVHPLQRVPRHGRGPEGVDVREVDTSHVQLLEVGKAVQHTGDG